MKTLKTTIIENQDYLDERVNLRSVSGVMLVGKIQQVSKNIKSISIVDSSSGQIDPKKLDKKINLLSEQNVYQSVLMGSLQLLSKGKGRR